MTARMSTVDLELRGVPRREEHRISAARRGEEGYERKRRSASPSPSGRQHAKRRRRDRSPRRSERAESSRRVPGRDPVRFGADLANEARIILGEVGPFGWGPESFESRFARRAEEFRMEDCERRARGGGVEELGGVNLPY